MLASSVHSGSVRPYTSAKQTQASLFNRPFMLLCLAAVLFFSATYMLMPLLPQYLGLMRFQGAAVGTLVSAFLISSLCIRPWVGKLVDRGNRPQLILEGLAASALCFFLYLVVRGERALLILRIVHGISFALVYTALSSAAVDLIPAARRVEGLSHFSNAMKIAMAIGPPLGLWFGSRQWHAGAFALAAVFGVLALLCVWSYPVAGPRPSARSLSAVPPSSRGRLICGPAVLPGLIMTINGFGFGALIPYMPMLSAEKSLANPGLFYAVYSFCLIFSRGFTGKMTQRFGRSSVLALSIVSVSVALLMMARTSSPSLFLVAAALYGLSNGVLQPSLLSLAVDRSPRTATGSAMATFSLLNDLGTAGGQFFMAYLGISLGYSSCLLWISLFSFSGWGLYAWMSRREARPSEAFVPMAT